MRNAEVIRQWQILRSIESSRTGVTIHELAEEAGVTTRTIRRDLQALQEAGFAVYDEGEEHDTKRWRLDAQPFRSVESGLGVADVAALYLSRSVVEAFSAWPLADELRFLFISGDVQVRPATTDEVFVSAQPTTKAKCVRCWHHRADVGSNADHPELCGRCVSNVTGAGEVRSWF